MAHALPRKYLPRYDLLFAKEFACVAEELALNTTIHQAEVSLELQGLEANLDGVYDEAFQDTDFEFLFDPKFDRVEETKITGVSGTTNLRFENGFKPFANVPYVHPYVAAAPARPSGRRP